MLSISVIIPTLDRIDDLNDLLGSIANQNVLPSEVIVVDSSSSCSAESVFHDFRLKTSKIGCISKYVKGGYSGLTESKNLGFETSTGDAVLFLDDDTILHENVIYELSKFLLEHPSALAVQPVIHQVSNATRKDMHGGMLWNTLYKVMMLSYHTTNQQYVRRSGTCAIPLNLSEVIPAQKLSGCACYRRSVLEYARFDTNLVRWGFMEDFDFSYRVFKKNPKALFITPNARIIHKRSPIARLPKKDEIYMRTIYWFYIFFKDLYSNSLLNLAAFLWAFAGYFVSTIFGEMHHGAHCGSWKRVYYIAASFFLAMRNLKYILLGNLGFFNRTLKGM